MINFYYETEIEPLAEDRIATWIRAVILSEDKSEGELSFVLCDDNYLLKINQKFLDHDTYTDIISFDNTIGNELHGDVFISTERVMENSKIFNVTFENELKRVLVHGVLHFCGYKDKSESDKRLMRKKEDEKLLLFHVEQ